jgi:hypothetical protein
LLGVRAAAGRVVAGRSVGTLHVQVHLPGC